MNPSVNILDPYLIKEKPVIVFSDHTSGLIEFIIKWRTKAQYNHVMWLTDKGVFTSQGNTYSEVPASRYMKKNNRLLFIGIRGLTSTQRRLILKSIEAKTKLPWYKKMYDWVGIIGQATGFTGLNIKGLNYCSEDVLVHFKKIEPYVSSHLVKIIEEWPYHPSPEQLRKYLLKHEYFYEMGIWNGSLSGVKNENFIKRLTNFGFLRLRNS